MHHHLANLSSYIHLSRSSWHLILSSIILADSSISVSSMHLNKHISFFVNSFNSLVKMLNRTHPNPSTCLCHKHLSEGEHHSVYNPVLPFIMRAMALNWIESDVTSRSMGYMRWLSQEETLMERRKMLFFKQIYS